MEITAIHGFADLIQKPDEETLVVNGGQSGPDHLARPQQVADVSPGIMLAGVAVATFLNRPEVGFHGRPLDVPTAVMGEDGSVASCAGGGDAVESVAPVLHAGEDVIHGRDPQNVPGLVLRQLIAGPRADLSNDSLFHGPADPKTVKIKRADAGRRLVPQILVIRPLNHAEQGLIRLAQALGRQPLMLGQAPLGPTEGALHGPLLVTLGVHERGQFVKGEHDVSPQLVLDPHGDFRRKPFLFAVEGGLESHAVLVHEGEALLAGSDGLVRLGRLQVHGQGLLEAGPQRHDLEAAGIGESGLVPVHELAQTTGRVQHVFARPLEQVEGVGQSALGA